MNIKKKSSIFVLILYLFLFLFPSVSSAHAYILKSAPFENEILKSSPLKVTIQFDESIQPVFNSLQVYDSKGNQIDQKNGHINSKNSSILEADLKKNLPKGTYRIQWKVVSNDGHPVQGVIPFQIGGGSKVHSSTTLPAGTQGYTPHGDLIFIRWFQYLSNACFVGMLFLYLLVLPKELRKNPLFKTIFIRIIWLSYFFLLVSIILSLPLQAVIESGTAWSKVLHTQTLSDIISNTLFGHTWIIQMVILFTLAVSNNLLSLNRITKLIGQWLCFSLGIGLLLTKALTGHASSTTNKILSISMDFFHLFAASIWIGSLIGIVALLPLRKNIETNQLYFKLIQRFSKWGIILVLLLSFTGVFSSFTFIPNLPSLIHTNYGRVLLSKVVLLFLMLILAAVNFVKGKRGKEKELKTSLIGELAIGVVVLMLSVILTNLPTAISSPGPFYETKTVNGNIVSLKVTPNIIGENVFTVALKNSKGQPLKSVEQVTLTFTSLEMGMGDASVRLPKSSKGLYEVKGMHFNMAGRWNVHIHILTTTLDNIDTDFRCIVGSQ
ncbi:copper resistance protein CopC [Neobacillus ginsengisoli]|uniref:Copper transport protein n=1 Tax=Neobacillus ginsengisoli TaxID=904295 RepID=A0ABT9XRZ2_9BACI|nr:copper resistance protein CopC [Neobacillus ginsengisoli]MDQ0198336.1 copper transport protein [Neobacillus ginsengisoli]